MLTRPSVLEMSQAISLKLGCAIVQYYGESDA